MEQYVRYEILGPLRVSSGSAPVAINASRERTLLAMLLLHANQPVPHTRLIEAIWARHPPPGARNQLQGCVSRLRRRLAEAGASPGLIVTEPAGYRATVAPDDLDLLQFREHVTRGRAAAAGDRAQAINHYRAGLALWHGPALAGIDSDPVRHAAATLDEEHAEALEERIDLELATNAGPLVAELIDLVGRHPHRERLHRALMLALYRSGRQADALAAFRRARRLLRDELGIEPGGELQRLHQAILNRDLALDAPPQLAAPSPAAGGRAPAPRELPADVAGFTGRTDALKALDELLTAVSEDGPAPVTISVIAGTAGVGKTSLAVHWAHTVADRFPDGQVYLDLRGFDPHGAALSSLQSIRRLLEALGVPAGQVSADLDAAVGHYRSLLAGRRLLLVLDNARDSEQVLPLLPGAPGCVAVVTSRRQLSGLVVATGASAVELDVLSSDEARELLERRVGAARVAAEVEAVEEIIDACVGLPLALAIVAARAAVRPSLTLAQLARQLREHRGSLEALRDPDPVADVRLAFDTSYQALDAEAGHLFRLLGLHAGLDITAPAAASLAGIAEASARRLLAELVHAHLVSERAPGRYAMHDLLRGYAADLGRTIDPEPQRTVARLRLLDHYLHTAHAATLLLDPHRAAITLPPIGTGVTPERLADARQARAWFAAERTVLLTTMHTAAAAGFDAYPWRLAWTLLNVVDRSGWWHEYANALPAALEAARRLADRHGQAHTHRALGWTLNRLDRIDDAVNHLRLSLDLYAHLGDDTGQAHVHHILAMIEDDAGRYESALTHAEDALALYRQSENQVGKARALAMIGVMRTQLGAYERALADFRHALALQRRLGDRQGQANTWSALGYAQHRLGQHHEAIACYHHALDAYRDLGDRSNEGRGLVFLGDAHRATGDLKAARRTWEEALTISIEVGHTDTEEIRTKLTSVPRA